MKKIGIYIHIPFCKQKCYYCDFTSFAQNKIIQEEYIKCLIEEIKDFKAKNEFEISTIYIGGGTPSYINSKYIKEILNLFYITNQTEVTIEVNPGTVTFEKLKDYKETKINRLSIGLQSTENKILRQIGRIHNFEDFLATYQLAKQVGFNNINVDLIIGLPNQSIVNIKKSLEDVVKLEPNHISVYSLIIEKNTPIEELIRTNKLKLPSEELERQMYWYVKDFLELKGYKHYEISNFAKKGFESKHNLDCWEQKEYIGFGLAAHSYLDSVRFSNTDNLDEYLKNCKVKKFDINRQIQEKQDKYIKEQEYMLIGLRKLDGISIQSFKNKFGENPVFIFRNELNKLVEEELLKINSDKISLTSKGLDFANLVWEEFV